MSKLQKKIKTLETKINHEQQSLRVNGSLLGKKLGSPEVIFSVLIGSVGVGYFLARHHPDPKMLKQKIATGAPKFFTTLFKGAQLLLPFIL